MFPCKRLILRKLRVSVRVMSVCKRRPSHSLKRWDTEVGHLARLA